jgi:2-haloacid dehalogenase
MHEAPRAVIFDMGNVLIDWNPRPALQPLFNTESELEAFFANDWRLIYDAVHDRKDLPLAECVHCLRHARPDLNGAIDIYVYRWAEFVRGTMDDSIAVVTELANAGVALFGLTNWPAQVWPPQRVIRHTRYDFSFLDKFTDVVVSGVEQMRKPQACIYRLALQRFGLDSTQAVFVDDMAANVEAARAQGIDGIVFENARGLRESLRERALI